MKRVFLQFTLYLTVITGYCYSQCGWFCTYPYPTNNDLLSMSVSNQNTIVVVGRRTILLTTNAGLNWTNKLFCSNDTLNAIQFINQNTGYVIGTDPYLAGVFYKTTNQGYDWIRSTVSDNFRLKSVYFLNSNSGFAGGSGTGGSLLRTANGGINWVVMSSPINVYIKSIVFPNNLTGYLAGENHDTLKVFKTIDGGNNWQQVLILATTRVNSTCFINELTGFVFGDRQPISVAVPYLRKTTNGGTNWTSISILPVNSIIRSMFFTDQDTGYVCGSDFVSKSTNGGNNWFQIYQGPAGGNSIKFANSNTGFVDGNSGIILKTSNSGLNWTRLSQDGSSNYVYRIKFFNQYTGFAINGKDFLKTTNSGNNWETVFTVTSVLFEDLAVINSDTIFACLSAESSGSIVKSINGGINWLTVNSITGRTRAISFLNSNTGFCSSTNIIWKTTNAGINWTFQNVNFSAYNGGSIFTCDSNVTYVNAWDKTTKTTNGGQNWFDITHPGFGIHSLFFINALTGFTVGYNFRIYKTTNGGLNWVQKVGISNAPYLNSITFFDNSKGLAAGDNGKVYKTTNTGENWSEIVFPLDKIINAVSMTDTNTFHFGGGYNCFIYKTTNGGNLIGISNINLTFLGNYVLHQNYPNPFNPQTKIKFDIPKSSFTTIIVYDLLGREVATLVNEELKSGTYEADWDASGFSSGVYFYKIISGDYSETKKMVLMK